jgi:hypothetical protein
MPNPIKYTAGTETLALKKGNFYIGTGDVGKGPSDTTGYYQGPSPASGGYVVYLNKSGVPGNLSYHSAANDSQLISFTNNLSGTSFTSATQCLNYYATQTDKVCFNRDYEPIVTNGLIFNLDAGFTPSYSRSGTTWYDVSLSGNNGTLANGPTFNSGDGGSIVFDGTDDYGYFPTNNLPSGNSEISYNCWFKWGGTYSTVFGSMIFGYGNDIGPNKVPILLLSNSGDKIRFEFGSSSGVVLSTNGITSGTWVNAIITYDKSFCRMYVNGDLNNSTSYSSANIEPSGSSGYTGSIGTLFSNYGNIGNPSRYGSFNGSIVIAQIYNRALSASEVLQNYNAQKSRFGL